MFFSFLRFSLGAPGPAGDWLGTDVHIPTHPRTDSHFSLAELLAMAADLAKSLTGSVAFTRRTRGMVTRGRFTGTTLGTGETRPRYSKSLERGKGCGDEAARQHPQPSVPQLEPSSWR